MSITPVPIAGPARAARPSGPGAAVHAADPSAFERLMGQHLETRAAERSAAAASPTAGRTARAAEGDEPDGNARSRTAEADRRAPAGQAAAPRTPRGPAPGNRSRRGDGSPAGSPSAGTSADTVNPHGRPPAAPAGDPAGPAAHPVIGSGADPVTGTAPSGLEGAVADRPGGKPGATPDVDGPVRARSSVRVGKGPATAASDVAPSGTASGTVRLARRTAMTSPSPSPTPSAGSTRGAAPDVASGPAAGSAAGSATSPATGPATGPVPGPATGPAPGPVAGPVPNDQSPVGDLLRDRVISGSSQAAPDGTTGETEVGTADHAGRHPAGHAGAAEGAGTGPGNGGANGPVNGPVNTPANGAGPVSAAGAAGTGPVTVAAVGHPAAAGKAGTPGTAGVAGARAVAILDQVLPVVPRVVQRGDGTSRLTLKLHPADLGEVHLTVSVRNQNVDVTVSAGPEARAALGEGSARLRSMLEGIGHTSGQVTFRDLAGAPLAGGTAGGPGQGGNQPGSQWGQSGNQSGSPWSQPGSQPDGQPGQPAGQTAPTGDPTGGFSDRSSGQRGPVSVDPGRDRATPGHPPTPRPDDDPRLRPRAVSGLDVTI
jgi:flagellar hook-length control protein FliK